MRPSKLLIIWLLTMIMASASHAVQPDEILSDPQLEQRARDLSTKLRCMVCQNQSIDESDAPLARDLRILIRDQLQEKKTDGQIIDYFVARYGDYVLLHPKLTTKTIILWTLPFVLLLGGLGLAMRRKPLTSSAEAPLTKEEQESLAATLAHRE